MEVFHPFYQGHKTLMLDPAILAFVEALDPLPTEEREVHHKKYWLDMGLGSVPAGTYTKVCWESAMAYEGLCHALGGRKITRHAAAVALGFQSADDVDRLRAKLVYPADAQVTRGAPGVSVRSYASSVPDVLATEAAKRLAEAAAGQAVA